MNVKELTILIENIVKKVLKEDEKPRYSYSSIFDQIADIEKKI